MASVQPAPFLEAPSRRRAEPRGLLVLLGAAALSVGLLLWAVDSLVFAGAFVAALAGTAAIIWFRSEAGRSTNDAEPIIRTDRALLRAALDTGTSATAITGGDGMLASANGLYFEWFGGNAAPADLPFEEDDAASVRAAAAGARRDGSATAEGLRLNGMSLRLDVSRAGVGESHLLWKFSRAHNVDLAWEARRLIGGDAGTRIGEAGVMAALADDEGKLTAANRAFVARALGDPDAAIAGAPLIDLLSATPQGQYGFAAEGKGAGPLRIVQVPVSEGRGALTLFLMLDDAAGLGGLGQEGSASLHALLDFLPIGLALANSDGRFVYLNKSFRKAASLGSEARPIYPGDLVVDEDKAAVSDAVRRFARGRSLSSDIAIRLKSTPDEPVALTIAGARGLGDAAVILSLKDSSEEDRLKRQVAQATKMQAVGQLAGGVAHDFNNILTAILGYCDLMLMRHTPGDSDYDDIQQIRSNSNRAAGLTRQLLAFSRQQTLRPQVLQLPDVVSEVSHLLKRLLGETVQLALKH
ncbi:MAG: hybrid sensor histidine kinase/response regulator, partial [Pseudomonadota bacterium]|nr:hybrid sensor histidine kinase/response regulator [Pseudomonadota bacterium]